MGKRLESFESGGLRFGGHPNRHALKHAVRECADDAVKLQELIGNQTRLQILASGDPIVAGGFTAPDYHIKALRKNAKAALKYAHSLGVAGVRSSLAEHESQKAGVEVSPDDLLVSAGVAQVIALLLETLAPNGEPITNMDCYPSFTGLAGLHAGQTHEYQSLEDGEINLVDLEQKLSENPSINSIVIINPNNPTGKCYSQKTLEGVCDLAVKYGVLLIFDHIYYNLDHTKPFTHVLPIAREKGAHIVCISGASKDIPDPGSRAGYMVFEGPKNKNGEFEHEGMTGLKETMEGLLRAHVASPHLGQLAMASTYTNPDFSNHLKTYNAEIARRVSAMADGLKQIPGLKVNTPDAGFYIPVDIEAPLQRGMDLPPMSGLPDPAAEFLARRKKELIGVERKQDAHLIRAMLGNTGIGLTELSGFNRGRTGFRVVALQPEENVPAIIEKIGNALEEYISSLPREI